MLHIGVCVWNTYNVKSNSQAQTKRCESCPLDELSYLGGNASSCEVKLALHEPLMSVFLGRILQSWLNFNLLIFSLSPLICMRFASTTHACLSTLRNVLPVAIAMAQRFFTAILAFIRPRMAKWVCLVYTNVFTCTCVWKRVRVHVFFLCILKDSISRLWGHRCPDALNTHAHTQQKHTPIAWN